MDASGFYPAEVDVVGITVEPGCNGLSARREHCPWQAISVAVRPGNLVQLQKVTVRTRVISFLINFYCTGQTDTAVHNRNSRPTCFSSLEHTQ